MALIDEYCESYMAKIFYFCLKKTGVEDTAAELAAEINLEVVKALAGGVRPGNFGGWVWAVARNRWARFAKASYYGAEMDVIELSEAAESSAGDMSAEDNVILADELSRMRRELAFIRADYRQILVAHYFDDMSVSKIAELYNLPVGTVKTRLQASRRILKEGMEMAREFGPKSYKPEDVEFAATGNQPSGLPWSAVNRLLPKNILLEAADNPSTVEELSVSLGIAAPYMEEEVDILVRATLMRKEKDRYVTDFYIMDKSTRLEIYDMLRRDSKRRSELFSKAADRIMPVYRDAVEAQPWMTDGYLKWRLVLEMIDQVLDDMSEITPNPKKRANGETWGFMGYELAQIPEKLDLAVMDVSFISIRLVLPAVKTLLKEGADLICLIKPQFEAGRDEVGKKGVVRDEAVHREVVQGILDFVPGIGLSAVGLDYSPIKGPEGNIEYICHLINRAGADEKLDAAAVVERSHKELSV